jgi:hypothetical protein
MNDQQARDALVGAWRLLSWENRADDGQVSYPMGTDALGYLLSGATEEKARAVEGFVAYAGRYSFHGDRVVHHVELSLFPNWVGSDQERSVELTGDRLTLSASPLLLAGKQQVPRLVWERVDPSPGAA